MQFLPFKKWSFNKVLHWSNLLASLIALIVSFYWHESTRLLVVLSIFHIFLHIWVSLGDTPTTLNNPNSITFSLNYTLNDLLRHLTALKKHTICTNLWLLNFPCDFIFSKVDCLKLLMLPGSFCTNGKPHYIVFTFRLSALNSQLIKCKVYINVHKACDTFFCENHAC